jgi:outer membrane protein OmpA-like peptidoglycan-associated protein
MEHLQAEENKPEVDFAPTVSLKTNLLYDATTTLNLGVEVPVGRKWSIDVPVNYNPWTFEGGRKIKHWLVQPAVRYWMKQTFEGSFFGAHTHGAQYNVARIGGESRYQGWLAGAGLSYGYRWNWSRHWGMEAEIGVGYAHLDYSKYDIPSECGVCGTLVRRTTKNYFGVTKAALSLVHTFGKKKQATTEIDYSVPALPAPVYEQPQVDTIYVVPTPTVEYRSEMGRASVWFPVNRSDLNPDVMQNRSELTKIARSMEIVRSDPSSEIQHIEITAYSSPEGNEPHNKELAHHRAETLRDYMCSNFGLDSSLFEIIDGGENWESLRTVIAASEELTTAQRVDLERIIATADIAKRKELLKSYQGGRIYQWLLKTIYPLLRTAEYEIEYSIEIK